MNFTTNLIFNLITLLLKDEFVNKVIRFVKNKFETFEKFYEKIFKHETHEKSRNARKDVVYDFRVFRVILCVSCFKK
jgi:hypothetical protein